MTSLAAPIQDESQRILFHAKTTLINTKRSILFGLLGLPYSSCSTLKLTWLNYKSVNSFLKASQPFIFFKT